MDILGSLTWPVELWAPIIQRTLVALGIVLLLITLISVFSKFSLRKAIAMGTIATVVGMVLGGVIAQSYSLASWRQDAQARLESRSIKALELYPTSSTVKLDIEGCVFTAKLWLDSYDADFATEPDVWEYILTDSTESLQEHCE